MELIDSSVDSCNERGLMRNFTNSFSVNSSRFYLFLMHKWCFLSIGYAEFICHIAQLQLSFENENKIIMTLSNFAVNHNTLFAILLCIYISVIKCQGKMSFILFEGNKKQDGKIISVTSSLPVTAVKILITINCTIAGMSLGGH